VVFAQGLMSPGCSCDRHVSPPDNDPFIVHDWARPEEDFQGSVRIAHLLSDLDKSWEFLPNSTIAVIATTGV